jgi:glycosyltransferase involved in cell wall biosynthesis
MITVPSAHAGAARYLNTLPSFTAVIECENVRSSELSRAEGMLKVLAQQIRELDDQLAQAPELIILYDSDSIDPSLIRRFYESAFGPSFKVPLRLLPTKGANYYVQKNRGAQIAERELVLFVDSDVIPEEDWLRSLLSAFVDPQVNIVGGNTYITLETLYSKAFALFWFFPLRSESQGLVSSTRFYANNVIFRRDVFRRYGFPDLPLVRGQCGVLANSLVRDGYQIFIQTDAHVAHAPPNGFRHIVCRALCQGHDYKHRNRDGLGGSASRYVTALKSALQRITAHRRDLNLGPFGALSAFGIATLYYTICFSGEVITHLRPTLIRDRYAV